MRTVIKIIGGLVVASVLVLGCAVAYWLTADANAWKGQLTEAAKAYLGRAIVVGGELQPTFSLANGFGLRVTGVSVANAAGYQPANMVSINELELVVDVMAALDHRIHVKKFMLKDADVVLEARGDANNWTFKEQPRQAASKADAGSDDTPALQFAVDDISISNLSLTHIQNGVRKEYKVASFDAAAADNAPVTVALAATADGKPVTLDVTAGTLAQIEAGQKQRLTADLAYGALTARLAADYRRAEAEHSFSNLEIAVNQIKAAGNVAINLGGSVPMLMVDVSVPVIDLAALGGDSGAGAGAGSGSGTGNDAPLFSREPLPWDALRSANASIALDIKQLMDGEKAYGPANLQAKLQGGALNATLVAQPPSATRPITLKTQASAAKTVQLVIDAPGLDAATLAGWLGQDEALVQAPAHFNLNIVGGGSSLHDVMGGANGALSLDFAPGKLNTGALPLTVSTVLASVIGADKLNNASVACLKADFGIVNGVATTRGVGTAASVMNASGDGSVNLREETIAMRFVVDAQETSRQIPLLPVGISGALKSPAIAADTKALTGQVIGKVVENVGGKFGGIAQALVGGGGTNGTVEKPFNPCRPNDRPTPAPAAAPSANPAAQLQDALKNPNAAKELLKDPSKLLNMFGGQ